MENCNRFVVGVRPGRRMFRFASKSGELIDELLSVRGHGRIKDDYFKTVHLSDTVPGAFTIKSKDGDFDVTVDSENIVFGKSDYFNGDIDFGGFIQDVSEVWAIMNKVIKFDEVRRIGVLLESQYELSDDASSAFFDKALNFSVANNPVEPRVRFVERVPKDPGDLSVDPFKNTIIDIYDSVLDRDNPSQGKVNVNVDCQEYYNPLLSQKSVIRESKEIFSNLKRRRSGLIKDLKASGVI